MNQAVGEKNRLDKSGGRKRPVLLFTRNGFCKCLGCIILAVTYGIKRHQLGVKPKTYVSKKWETPLRTPLHIYVRGKTYLLKGHIALITFMLTIELFYLTLLHSFIGYYCE